MLSIELYIRTKFLLLLKGFISKCFFDEITALGCVHHEVVFQAQFDPGLHRLDINMKLNFKKYQNSKISNSRSNDCIMQSRGYRTVNILPVYETYLIFNLYGMNLKGGYSQKLNSILILSFSILDCPILKSFFSFKL